MKKILIATVKPFAPVAIKKISKVFKKAGYKTELLEKYESKQELLDAVKKVDAAIIRSDKFDAEVLDAAKKLKIVVRAGAGYDNVDLATATENGVVVMNTPGQNSNAVAELALGMMVFIARGKFNGKPGSELKGKVLGIHAYGNVGKNIARIAKGFGMKVLAFDPFVNEEIMNADGVNATKSVDELYSQSDYISLNLPKVKATIGFVNYNLMSKMKKGAVIVNTARKEVVDEEALKRVLEEDPDFKYLSDVAPDCREELEEKYADRCYFTPKKMGAQTEEANVNAGIAAAKQIVDFIENGVTTFQVNK